MDLFNKLELEMAIDQMYAIMPEQIKMYKLQSKLLKEYFNALLSEGFTETQALSLVKTHGIKGGVIGDKGDIKGGN